jgi:ketosteroid isomerase-like protein
MKHVLTLTGIALLAAGCQQAPPPAADPRIDALVDRQAIDQLVAGDYPHALDHQDWKTYASYYTEDGELLLGEQTAKGREGIIKFLSGLPPDSKVIHVISNSSYVIKGDTATGGAYWQDIGVADTRQGVVAAGHYEDTLRKVDGAWKFAKRAIVIEFVPTPAAAPADASK